MFTHEMLIVMIRRLEKKGLEREIAKPPLGRRSSSRRLGPLAFATKVPVFI